jgi:hypothetical protein
MSEQQPDDSQTSDTPLRGPDGKFVKRETHDKLKAEIATERKETLDVLHEDNLYLMKATPFDEHYFEGMNSFQINKFLKNYIKNKHKDDAEKPAEEPEKKPQSAQGPIIPIPAGTGKTKYFFDEYLTMNPTTRELNLDIPASLVFNKDINKKKE